ncbi:MAG: ABC transporter permease [Chloroflexota bacterium]
MNRLIATLNRELISQMRNGFYIASIFIIMVWIALFQLLPRDSLIDFSLIFPAFIMLNLLMTTFYFVGALVLLEKSEGSLMGLVVTPLRAHDYLSAKIISLVGLAGVETLLVLLFVSHLDLRLFPILAAIISMGSIFTLIGFVVVMPYDSINTYLLPSVLVVLALLLPLLHHFDIWQTPLIYLHPLQPAMSLARFAFMPETQSGAQLAYGIGGSLIWMLLIFEWARGRYAYLARRLVEA